MTDEILFDGVKHIAAIEAAGSSGLTRDYVARLCREGKIRGRQVGKNWYVVEDSLSSFLVNQSYLKATRREELTRARLSEYHSTSKFGGDAFTIPAGQARIGKEIAKARDTKLTVPVPEVQKIEKVADGAAPMLQNFNVHAALAKAATKR